MLEPHSFKPKHLFFFLIFILRPEESDQWGQPHFVKWNVEPDHDGRPNWIGWPEPSGGQANEGMGRCVLFLLLVLGLPLKMASLAEGQK